MSIPTDNNPRVGRTIRSCQSPSDYIREDAKEAQMCADEKALAEEPYECPKCGFHEFLVEHEFDMERNRELTLPCSCDEEHEVAGRWVFREWVTNCQTGRLKHDHHVEWEDKELIEEDFEEIETDVSCGPCVELLSSDECQFEHDAEEWVDCDDSHRWTVRCGSCGHEIQFGWSHPDRGGRIWPVASSDWNPWKCWPEPRFKAEWAERGWLRPVSPKKERA